MPWFESVLVIIGAFVAVAFAVAALIQFKIRKDTAAKYNSLFEASDDFVIIWSTDLKLFESNTLFKDKFGCEKKNCLAELVPEIFGNNRSIHNFDKAELMQNALAEGGRESTIFDKQGKPIYCLWNSRKIDKRGNADVIISIGQDMSEIKELKEQLAKQRETASIFEENYSIAMESAEIGIITINVDNYVYTVHLSQNGRKILGFSDDEKITLEKVSDKVYLGDRNNYTFQMNRLLIGIHDTLAMDVKMQIKPEIFHNFMMKFKVVRNENDSLVRITGAFIDVTSQREIYSLYDKSAFEDELTGLPNRRKFLLEADAFISIARKNKHKTALLFIDMDNFQKVNTLFGFETGDRVLKWFGMALASFVNKTLMVAKTGTDDFAVLMELNDDGEIDAFAVKLQNSLEKHIVSETLREQVRFSMGVCVVSDGDDAATAYNKAYIALISGKKNGIAKITVYNQAVEKMLLEREILENEIADALKSGQFELYYQPKISFKTNKLMGMEALMRWHHPKRGLLPPGAFISVAEEIGLITKIDEWGLSEACRQNKLWQDKGYPAVKISVNISQAQLYQTDIISTIKQVLKESGLDPKWLEIEITETMAMQDIEHTVNTLRRIKELGVSISMDDFGSGYSSLSSLKAIPIDILKIDRSLVYDVEENNTSKHITNAIIALGKAMKLVTLAEGVETKAQGDFLSSIGCDLAQGYFYGKPQSSIDMERLFLVPAKQEESTML